MSSSVEFHVMSELVQRARQDRREAWLAALVKSKAKFRALCCDLQGAELALDFMAYNNTIV